ncbi:hypothetical protein D3C85_1717540 [compost metagenome]
MAHPLGVAMLFDRRAVVAVEGFAVAQPPGQQKVELRPQLAEVVFQRGAGQTQSLASL